MGVALSLNDVPDAVMEKLRQRATLHRRSLEGEVLAIVEAAVSPRRLTGSEILAETRRLGLQTPSESAAMVREDRDSDDR